MLRAIRSLCARPQIVRRSREPARFLPRQRRLFSLGSEGGLLQLLLLLFCSELRRSGAAPLTVEMGDILLVDLLLLLRRPANFALHSESAEVFFSLLAAFSAMSAHASKSVGPRDHHCASAHKGISATPAIAAISSAD